MSISKRMKEARSKIDPTKTYPVAEAVALVKETAQVKFDASVELHINLGIDTKKGEQAVRGTVTLPHGSGKKVRIAAFVPASDVAKAKEAGAVLAGDDDLIEQIKTSGKCDFDVAVATPDMMKKLAAVARILGQKGLMPNPKTGTIAPDFAKVIKELSTGRVSYKNDAGGTVHAAVGKVSFSPEQLTENINVFIDSVKRAKPDTIKGIYLTSAYIAASMGPSVKIAL